MTSLDQKACDLAAEFIRIWANWETLGDEAGDDALRDTAKEVRALDLNRVDGVIASPLNYFAMAYLDELTQLPSRRSLNEALLKLGDSYSIAMLDVDHFKKFNDSYGHESGDQALRRRENVAASISQRANGVAQETRGLLEPPTRTQQEQYAIAAAEFEQELPKLRTLVETKR